MPHRLKSKALDYGETQLLLNIELTKQTYLI